MSKRRLMVIVLIIILIGVAGIGYWFFKASLLSAPLVLSGNVDIREVNLAFRVAGRVQEVRVDEGDIIEKPEQVLAVLDAEPFQNALNEAQANLATAQANLALMTAGYSPELNPEERLNADLKHAITSKVPPRTKAKLKNTAIAHMMKLEQSPERVKSYFQDLYVKYAA